MSIKLENLQRVKNHLYKLLGKSCKHCGSKDNLEFDHIVPNGYQRNTVGLSVRVFEWLESYDKGNLQVLCANCNKIKGDKVDTKKNYYYSKYCDRLTKCINCRSSGHCHKIRQTSQV